MLWWEGGSLCRGAARALSGRDGFDDQAAGLGGVDGRVREFEGLGDEVLHAGAVDHRRVGELDVADLMAGAGEEAVGIAQAGAVEEKEEADPARVKGDGKQGVGGAIGGSESDGEGVVVVVDEFLGAGKAGAQAAQSVAGLGGNDGLVLVEEGVELGGGRGSWGRLFGR